MLISSRPGSPHNIHLILTEAAEPTKDRSLKLLKPLAVLDVQSTGLDASTARIVKLSIIRVDPDGSEHVKTVILNPETPISRGATEVHGITDAEIDDKPVFRSYARSLLDHLDGCDLAGFGIERFGLPLLIAEFYRNGFEFSMEGRVVIDAMAIFHRLEPRDMNAAYGRFVNAKLPSEDGEAETVRKILEILRGQLRNSPDIPVEPAELSAWSKGVDRNAIDADGKFIWSDEGIALVNFGKHNGELLSVVVETDPGYLRWISSSENFSAQVREIVDLAIRGNIPVRESR